MSQVKEIIGICKNAEFVFNSNSSFALYIDFKLLENESAVSFYISEYSNVMEILKIINKNKTGMAYDMLDNNDLRKLIGMKAKIFCVGVGTKCYFSRFLKELEVKAN